jgi:DNA repair protein RadD
VAAEIIRRTVERGKRAIFLVHRRELVDQAVDRFAQFGLKSGRIVAGHPQRLDRSVQVASIPTLIKRAHWPADVVIVDECAHATSASWKTVIDRYPPPCVVIGLTATPIRLDGRSLGDIFGHIIEPVTTRELMDRGFLVEPRVFAPPIDLDDLPMRGGDYSTPELVERVSSLVGDITKTWLERAPGMSTVVFAVNIAHSLLIVEEFRKIGARAEHVDFKMSYRDRAATLIALRKGQIDIVSQVQLLTEGWDLPSLQCAVLARPTKSLALFRQMVGRVLRPPGPVIVLDHAGNHHEHGLVTDPVEWSLTGKPKHKTQSVSTCQNCLAIIPPGTQVCPVCGADPRGAGRDEVDPPGVHNEGVLVELDMGARPPPPADKELEYIRLVKVANDRGYKLGWARAQYKNTYGVWPRRLSHVEKNWYTCLAHDWAQIQCGPMTRTRCARCLEYQQCPSPT